MNEEHHKCPSRVAPFLIGAALGAAAGTDESRFQAAELRREIERLTDIERERLAAEQKRLAVTQSEARRNESDRIFRQSVFWLEHCNNDEKLEWILRGHGAALTDELAAQMIMEARQQPEVAVLFEEVEAARRALATSETHQGVWETLRDELRGREWTKTGVWLLGAAVGLAVSIPVWLHYGAVTVGGYGLFLAVYAGFTPLVVRWQPTPKDLAPQTSGFLFSGSLPEAIERVRETVRQAGEDVSGARIRLALAREAVMQAFRAMQPTLYEKARMHAPAIRARIDTLQAIYPPRVRCELTSISDEKLYAQLAPHFPAAIERGVAAML